MTTQPTFPEYLQSFEALEQHFRAEFESLTTTDKGDRFAHFVQRLIPQTEFGENFEVPTLSEKMTGDGGVDLHSRSKRDGSPLYIQAKLHVDRVDEIDRVLSKFQAYTDESNIVNARGQSRLFQLDDHSPYFLLVTLSLLSGIVEKYERSSLSSKPFYDSLKQRGRIEFIDGRQILQVLMTAYSKISHLPSRLTLNLEAPVIHIGNVYIGVVSSDELKALYSQFGDALFFENVRDFLGVPSYGEKSGRTSPNNEIIKTAKQDPDKMLSRNNGIVLGAQMVELLAENRLEITNGSVVNGCQTTMCIVENADQSCSVLVKVVQTDDAWDITKSANYQNSVPDIDLELARYLRPQLIRRAALNFGVRLADVKRSALQIIDEIYENKIVYSEVRLLYVGLFSRNPNNVFASNYTELAQDIISHIHKDPSREEAMFETMFMLQGESQSALIATRAIFRDPAFSKIRAPV